MSATPTALTEPDLEPEDTEAPPRRRRGRLLLLLPVLLAVAGAAWFLFLRGGEEEPPDEPEEGPVVEVAQMTVNLAGEDLHYLRFSFALVLAPEVAGADVEPRYPLVKDAALSVAQSFTQEELRTPAGTERLRSELTARARQVYPDGLVLRVVLTELLVQ